MRLGVAGVGVMGSAVADTFETLGHEVMRCDPHKGYDDDPAAPVIFICVWDSGDMSNVCKVADQWHNSCDVLVIKTTVMPGITDRLIAKYGPGVCFSPEFMSDATARADSMEPDKIVIGSRRRQPLLDELFEPFRCGTIYMDPVEAEILKLAINSFYAAKVTVANEIADLCEMYGANYEMVRRGMEADRFIAPNHLDINHKGYRGFGGKCLPKDLRMLLQAAHDHDFEPRLLMTTNEENESRIGGNRQCRTA